MTRPPKKSKAAPDFSEAQRACRTPAERELLTKVVGGGWTPAELTEYARLYFFRNARDYPTPTSYRRAIEDISGVGAWCIREFYFLYAWLNLFRAGGSKPRHHAVTALFPAWACRSLGSAMRNMLGLGTLKNIDR